MIEKSDSKNKKGLKKVASQLAKSSKLHARQAKKVMSFVPKDKVEEISAATAMSAASKRAAKAKTASKFAGAAADKLMRSDGSRTPEKQKLAQDAMAALKNATTQHLKAEKNRKRADKKLDAEAAEFYGKNEQQRNYKGISIDDSVRVKLVEDLRKWVQQRWVDIGAPKKGGGFKPCGRSKGEKRKGYPKCVPAAKAASMSKGQRRSAVKRKRAAGNPGGKPTMVSTFKKKAKKREAFERLGQMIEGKLCPKGKAAAKRKFDVYPSAYANMYASAVCSGKVTPGGKKGKKK